MFFFLKALKKTNGGHVSFEDPFLIGEFFPQLGKVVSLATSDPIDMI